MHPWLLPALDYYRDPGVRDLQHALKRGSDAAAYLMALDMAPHVPHDAVLVPIPSSRGYGGAGLLLAEHLAALTGCRVADVLRGRPRESLHALKKIGVDPTRVDLGFHLVGSLPLGTPVLVDNVLSSGHTAREARRVLLNALVLVHAVDPNPPVWRWVQS